MILLISLKQYQKKKKLSCSPSRLTLYTKKKADSQFITLNNEIFKDCQKNFNNLTGIYEIDEDNPIRVKLPDEHQCKSAKKEIIEFWKNLDRAEIIFQLNESLGSDYLEYLEIKKEQDLEFNLRPGISSKNNIYACRKKDTNLDMDLWSAVTEGFIGVLCLPNNVFFLGDEGLGSFLIIRDCYKELIIKMFKRDISKFGCIITGTPGIGKTYFGLYLLYYIRLHHPNATIVWQLADSDTHQCYQFMPDGNVLVGGIAQFYDSISNKNNYYIVDAQKPEKSSAYVILLTSPKAELYNSIWKSEGITKYYMPIWNDEEIITLWNIRYKEMKDENGDTFTYEKLEMLMGRWGLIPRILRKWKDDLYSETEFDKLINEVDLMKCLKSVNEEGMSKDSASGRLIHIIVEPNFRKYKFCFASSFVSDSLINAYERYHHSSVRDFLQSSYSEPKASGLRGNLFEDYAHRQLQKGGTFRIRELTKGVTSTEIMNKKMDKLYYNWFDTLRDVDANSYNRPRSRIFESTDSFVFNSQENTLDLFQVTVSKAHGVKVKGLEKIKTHVWNGNIKLYFVVPSDKFDDYPWQSYRGLNNLVSYSHSPWIDDLKQYVLDINLREFYSNNDNNE
ncbi:hypothetical protein RclHR1_12330004 [Rhizophagus clarus]|uniref:Crinkler effector protein N-terminal domain-containing protein n=1 Tax=Rhizophagus clarus TaxID=94130 RepID=A0A2Z6Q6X7_9GLOM|nr:hypothetical protein RclHR1_12330004 [Rhizophagus clarus]